MFRLRNKKNIFLIIWLSNLETWNVYNWLIEFESNVQVLFEITKYLYDIYDMQLHSDLQHLIYL